MVADCNIFLSKTSMALLWLYEKYPQGGIVETSELGSTILCNYPRIDHIFTTLSAEGCIACKETSEHYTHTEYEFMFTDKGLKIAEQLQAFTT